MNKKFSTLVATALLATSVGTVNAAAPVYAKYTANPTAATVVLPGKLYQIETATANTVLAMTETSAGVYELSAVGANTTDARFTLWTIAYQNNAEGGYSYVLTNYGTGMQLAIDAQGAAVKIHPAAAATLTAPAASIAVGGDVSLWKWVSAPNPVGQTFTGTALTSVFGAKRDSAMILTVNGAYVGAEKYALNNLPTSLATNALTIKPVNPAAILLGVDDLNSMLWKQNLTDASKTQFTFNKDVEGGSPAAINLFSKQAYKAVAAIGYPVNNYSATFTNAALTTTALKAYEAAVHSNVLAADIRAALGSTDALVAANAPIALAFAKAIAATVENDASSATAVLLTTAIKDQANISGTDAGKAVEELVRKALLKYVNLEGYGITTNPTYKSVFAVAATDGAATGIVNIAAAAAVVTPALADAAVKTYADAILTTGALYKAAYVEVEATGNATALAGNGWVSLKADDDNNYLMLDTAYLTSYANLKFSQKKFADLTANGAGEYLPVDNKTRLDINGRYNFQFVWHPSADSIVIRTGGYAKLENNGGGTSAAKYFKDLDLTGAGFTAPVATNHTVAVQTGNKEQNLVKIAVLANNHRELTVGNSDFNGTGLYTINTCIGINYDRADNRTTLASGLYFMNLQTELAKRKAENNGFKIAKLTASQFAVAAQVKYAVEEESQNFNTVQNYGYMPAAQWVVEKTVGGEAGKERVNIYNREYPSIKLENIQLYTDGKGNIALPNAAGNFFAAADTLKFTEVKTVKPAVTKAYTDTYLGYWQIDSTMLAEKMFKLDYLSGIELGNYVNVLDSQTDSIIRVDLKGAHTMFAIETAPVKAEGFFGYDGNLAKGTNRLFPQLRRTAYVLKVRDANKLEHNNKYVTSITTTSTGEPLYVVATIAKDKAQTFFFKENNRLVIENEDKVTETPYFAFVEVATPTHLLSDTLYSENTNRIGVKDASLLLSKEEYKETRVAAFAFSPDDTPLYRRFDTELESKEAKDQPVTVKFFRANNPKEFLYENGTRGTDAPSNAYGVKGINFLGMINEAQFAEKDDRSYSIYVDTAYVRNETVMPQYLLAVRPEVVKADTVWCGENHKDLADSLACIHTKVYPSFTRAQYLINAQDSVDAAKNGKSYLWQDYTRLAFVDAAHYNDTLYILRGANAGIATADINFTKIPAADKVALYKNAVGGHNNVKFSFRLIDDSKKFLIESKGDRIIPTGTTGGWVKYHNGVPVIAQNMTFAEAIRQAEIFDVTKDTKFAPTDNEAIGTTEVSVIAGEGQVVINNAAAKTVTISNILGQTIAQTVLTSDNATISVPAGIVVVTVEGEAAVKAIVR